MPFMAYAFAVPMLATSTNVGYIAPATVNGNNPFIQASYYAASSTGATTTLKAVDISGNVNIHNNNIFNVTTNTSGGSGGVSMMGGGISIGVGAPPINGDKLSITNGAITISSAAANYSSIVGPSNGLIMQGNLGIASSSPTYALSVEGTSTLGNGAIAGYYNATSTVATSTFADGLNLTGGCYEVAGACIGGSSGSGTVNSGTLGDLAFYASNGTAVSASNTAYLNPDGSFAVYSGLTAAGGAAQYIVATVKSALFTALDIRNNAGNGSSGEAINLSNISTSTSATPQIQIRGVDSGDFSQTLFFSNKVAGSFSNALQTNMEIKDNGCVINPSSGLTIQNITGGNVNTNYQNTTPCAANTLGVDWTSNNIDLFGSHDGINFNRGLIVPYTLEQSGFSGVDVANGGGGTDNAHSEFFFLDGPTTYASTSSGVGDTGVYTASMSTSINNSGSSYCVGTLDFINASSSAEVGNFNSDCDIAVPPWAGFIQDSGYHTKQFNSSDLLRGYVVANTNPTNVSGFDHGNYASIVANFDTAEAGFPGPWKLDVVTPGTHVYAFTVSGVSVDPTPGLLTIYTVRNTGFRYQVGSFPDRLSGGSGTLLLIGSSTPPASGVLVKAPQSGTGDQLITYSASALVPQDDFAWALKTNLATGLVTIGTSTLATTTQTGPYTSISISTSTFTSGISASIFNATSTTASSTFANGINLTKGCYAVLGACLTAGGTPASPSGSIQYNNAGVFGGNSRNVIDGTGRMVLTGSGGASGTTCISSAGLCIDNSPDAYFAVDATNGSGSGVLFGDPTNSADEGIIGNGGVLQFRSGGNTTYMTLDNAGDVILPHIGLNADGSAIFAGGSLSMDNAGGIIVQDMSDAGCFFDSSNSCGAANNVLTSNGGATQWQGLSSILTPSIVSTAASATSTGSYRNKTGTITSVNKYTPTASSTYAISVSTAVKAISAGTLTITCTYTNTDGTASTATFFPMGLTTAGLSGTGSPALSPLVITPMKNTQMTVVATFTGVSITYDIDASIVPAGTATQ